MLELRFVTTNSQKFAKASSVCDEHGIALIQTKLEIDEVQAEDTEYVARRKAEAAFATANEPVVISDDAWIIPGLNGFPGTYAKSINNWFTPEDYIRLTKDLEDRSIIFVQTLVYQDENTQKIFKRETTGVLLKEISTIKGVSIQQVVSLEPDQTTSITEMIAGGTHYDGAATKQVWQDFAKWYITKA